MNIHITSRYSVTASHYVLLFVSFGRWIWNVPILNWNEKKNKPIDTHIHFIQSPSGYVKLTSQFLIEKDLCPNTFFLYSRPLLRSISSIQWSSELYCSFIWHFYYRHLSVFFQWHERAWTLNTITTWNSEK